MPDTGYLAELILCGRSREAEACTRELLCQGVTPEAVVSEAFLPAMYEVGSRFDQREYFITDMLMSARAAKQGYAALRDWLGTTLPVCRHKAVIGTVQGDLHDIGKNLVAMAMRSVGVEVIDLGVDVAPQQFVGAVEADPDVALVAISALLTTTLPAMAQTVAQLKRCPAADHIRILVGGAPVTEAKAKAMGADVYTQTAFQAANAARAIIQKMEVAGNEAHNCGTQPGD